jgi:hypothetical protein
VRIALIIAVLLALGFSISAEAADFRSFGLPLFRGPLFHDVHAYVTGYNTVPGQTDDTPCIAASGANICGRTDAVACPRHIGLGTFLDIRGTTYICEDRLAKKHDSRFDISCDKDTNCPGQVTGWVDIKVFSEDPCRLPPPAPAVAMIARPLIHFAAFVPRAFHNLARSPIGLRARARWLRPV